MIQFKKRKNILILNYFYENDFPEWVINKFKIKEVAPLSRTFYFNKTNLLKTLKEIEQEDPEGLEFIFGIRKGEYYKIEKSILNIKNDLYIHRDFKLEKKTFVADYKISIFKYIDQVIKDPLYLGGKEKTAVSYEDFQDLLKEFPNRTEREKYCLARLSSILSVYFESRSDVKEKYEKYMNKKKSIQSRSLLKEFSKYEKSKYKAIVKKLKTMLKDEKKYNEKQWQQEIIEIIRLIFPKYIRVFKRVRIKDCYTNKSRELDYLLIDSEGYIDIIEVKRPLESQIVSKKPYYRNNHFPVRELSGAVMQVEKYILCLNKWGKIGEDSLNKKYKETLPPDLKVKITNPGAMIILGRSDDLNMEQKTDFEIIKRKYKNIIDIITYDDLINRLDSIISQYE